MTPAGGLRSATGGASFTPYSYGPDSTTGTTSKFDGGTGEGTCHSRPRDRHGLPVSRSRQNTVDMTTLIRKIRMDTPRQKAEIETQSLSVSRFRAYSNRWCCQTKKLSMVTPIMPAAAVL